MKLEIFTIHDVKAAVYNRPQFMINKAMAIRTFGDLVNDNHGDNNEISKHPEDYTLFHIGTWDDVECEIKPLKTPFSLGNGVDFVIPFDYDVDKSTSKINIA